MPQSSFFNLSSDKQNKIIHCAFKVFSENTYDKTSIFTIAKNVGISRGSIYCYFNDKEDIYNYLIYLVMDPYFKNIKQKQTPFEHAKNLFEYFLSFYGTDKQNFILMLFKNMNPKNIKYFNEELYQNLPCKLEINFDDLNIKSNFDIYILSFMILSNMAIILINYFENKMSKKVATKNYLRTIEIIEHGMLKGDNYD